jgi:E3 ubiquitin-protein ligase NEDD4
MSARRGGEITKTIRLTGAFPSSPPGTALTRPGYPPVVAADSLIKRDVFRLPDPFAVITVDGEQTHTTSVIKKTLNPYWNENFDV